MLWAIFRHGHPLPTKKREDGNHAGSWGINSALRSYSKTSKGFYAYQWSLLEQTTAQETRRKNRSRNDMEGRLMMKRAWKKFQNEEIESTAYEIVTISGAHWDWIIRSMVAANTRFNEMAVDYEWTCRILVISTLRLEMLRKNARPLQSCTPVTTVHKQ